jgi:flagellar biosynthesis GTPase FlhF
LNKLNLDSLKDKAKDLGVSGISKIKKPDLIQILENEFIKLLPILKEKKSNDLKNICRQCGIKGVAGYKKDYLVCQILEYHSSILKFKLDDIQEEKEKEPDIKIEQLSLIEQLEKQKQEIELKMKEETKRQEEEKRQKEKEEEEKRQKEEEEKKQKEKEEEAKRQKEKEKEEKKRNKVYQKMCELLYGIITSVKTL